MTTRQVDMQPTVHKLQNQDPGTRLHCFISEIITRHTIHHIVRSRSFSATSANRPACRHADIARPVEAAIDLVKV